MQGASCGGTFWAAGVPNARMKGLSGAIAATARRMSLSFTSQDGMISAQWPAWSQPKVAAVCIPSLVPCIFGFTLHYETIGVLCDLFLLNLVSCRILLTCRRALIGLQIDECNIAGRHHQCVTAIPPACGNESSRSPSPFCSMIVPSIGTSIVALRLICARLHSMRPARASHVKPVTLVLGILVALSAVAPLL